MSIPPKVPQSTSGQPPEAAPPRPLNYAAPQPAGNAIKRGCLIAALIVIGVVLLAGGLCFAMLSTMSFR